MNTILVTGAAGNVGQEVVHALQRRGARVVAADYRVERVAALFGDSDVAARPPRLPRPLDVVDVAPWRRAHVPDATTRHRRCREEPQPVRRLRTVQGRRPRRLPVRRWRGKNKIVPHRKVEDHLRARGDHYTNLRPGFFAQNLQSAYRNDIVEADRIYLPAGRNPVN